MSSKERRTVPIEAIEIYNQFIHGDISRREFLRGAKKFAVAGLSATAIVQALMPNYALGQQVARDDERIRASYETIPSPDGNGYVRGYLVRPYSADSRSETPSQLPGIIVVHENRGLNPHTEDVARRFALANFMAFAPDVLTSVGGYPGDDYQGGQLFRQIDNGAKFEDIVASALWLKNRSDCTGKIGVTGFCYGGSVSNQLAVRLGEDLAAAVPFYGGGAPAVDVPNIRAAIMVQHG
ncbi:MAG: dienelactone hydrolase family protein, partial [Gammaproteobacteria bacterium]|nr:dienelactone hydrolase family protein [Gammaproteobacteria bacterium]